jgi:hypothetical protein
MLLVWIYQRNIVRIYQHNKLIMNAWTFKYSFETRIQTVGQTENRWVDRFEHTFSFFTF